MDNKQTVNLKNNTAIAGDIAKIFSNNPIYTTINKEISNVSSAVKTAISDVVGGASLTKGGIFKNAGKSIETIIGTAQTVGGAGAEVLRAAEALGIKSSNLQSLYNIFWGVNSAAKPSFKYDFVDALIQGKYELNTPKAFNYPMDLDESSPCIQFVFKKFVREKANEKGDFNIIDSITLPIPTNLVEQYGINFNSYNAGVSGMVADSLIEIGKGLAEKGFSFSDMSDTLVESELGKIFKNAGNSNLTRQIAIKALLNSPIGEQGLSFFGLDKTAVEATTEKELGTIINPGTSVRFQGVKLRNHSFNWMFAPRSSQESKQLDRILKKFKENALPSTSDRDNLLMHYPSVCSVRIMAGADELYPFKNCFIQDIAINHAGGGTPSFFYDSKKPTVINVSIGLTEIELYTKNDLAKDTKKDTDSAHVTKAKTNGT